jgi:hypothetical protein
MHTTYMCSRLSGSITRDPQLRKMVLPDGYVGSFLPEQSQGIRSVERVLADGLLTVVLRVMSTRRLLTRMIVIMFIDCCERQGPATGIKRTIRKPLELSLDRLYS